MAEQILIRHESGLRFTVTCGDYTVVTGKGEDGDTSRDGMDPDQLFLASLGACIGVYVVGYCRHHGIPCDGMMIELSRETARAPSRTTKVSAIIRLGAEVSEKDAVALLQVAEHCHVHESIRRGVHLLVSLGETAKPGATGDDCPLPPATQNGG